MMSVMNRLLLIVVVLAAPLASRASDAAAVFEKEVRPLLDQYCADCHDADTETAFRLEYLQNPQRVHDSRKLATQVLTQLHEAKMPPKKQKAQPTDAERQRIIAWIEATRNDATLEAGDQADPGKVVLRRLNRYEYAKTVRDLFSLGMKRTWTYFVAPGKSVPAEGIEYSKRTLNLPWNLPPDEVDYGFDNIGDVLTLPPHLMEAYFDVAGLVVDNVMADSRARLTVVKIQPGDGKSDEQAARENLTRLTARAFRRPVTDEDVQPLVDLFLLARAKGEPFEKAMKVPVQAMLVTPDFLYRVEQGVAQKPIQNVGPVNDYELASRLSYFLWSSLPDAELFRLASEGKLSDPVVLEQQVRRMLLDPKVEALAEHFAPQWLQIENIQAVTPDPTLFPSFYKKFIAGAMRTEAIIFFDSVIVQDRSILDLINSDTTYINGYLAEFYGLIKRSPNKYEGFAFWKATTMPEARRGGVMTMAAVGAVTSTPTRSSPVKRGKWMLEAILGDPPPPPPANVEPLKEENDPNATLTLREKLEQNRANANCAACHQRMDPIGFAMENIDAIGRWRDHDGAVPVDATGTLKDGTTIQGTIGLKAEVLRCKDEFARCLTEHLLTYALGRKLEWYDEPATGRIVRALQTNDYRFSTLIVEIVKSHPFRNTRQGAATAR
ncbi:MAG TPA: hypothetical protein DDZ88_00835 [Verrucomicrobiales bacterium]|nr:hypothetical protein [Verrucomicrobiales bacterium]